MKNEKEEPIKVKCKISEDYNKISFCEIDEKIIYFDFKKGIIRLIISKILKTNEKISGYLGPAFDNIAEWYQDKYICKGNGSNTLNCKINKNDQNKVEFDGKYTIYNLEGYSYNPMEINNRSKYLQKERKIKNMIIYIFKILVIIILIINIKFIKNKYH